MNQSKTIKVMGLLGVVEFMALKEITDLLEIRHNDAMSIVTKMATDPEFGSLRKSRSPVFNSVGVKTKDIDTYELDKRQSIALA